MPTEFVALYLIVWSLIGSGLFFVYVVFVFRTGLVYTARKPDGTLKERVPLSSRLAMGSFVLLVIGFMVCANILSLPDDHRMSFWTLFKLNYELYAIIFLFDTLFIDAFVLGIWRPKFLKLSEDMGRESMKRHILISIPIGLVGGGDFVLVEYLGIPLVVYALISRFTLSEFINTKGE